MLLPSMEVLTGEPLLTFSHVSLQHAAPEKAYHADDPAERAAMEVATDRAPARADGDEKEPGARPQEQPQPAPDAPALLPSDPAPLLLHAPPADLAAAPAAPAAPAVPADLAVCCPPPSDLPQTPPGGAQQLFPLFPLPDLPGPSEPPQMSPLTDLPADPPKMSPLTRPAPDGDYAMLQDDDMMGPHTLPPQPSLLPPLTLSEPLAPSINHMGLATNAFDGHVPLHLHQYGAEQHMGMSDDFAPPAVPQQRLTAFACLRFSDGSYYMHTYQIILGRNVELAHRDMRRLKKVERLQNEGDFQGAAAVLQGKKRKRPDRRPHSVISEAGGIVSAPITAMPIDYQTYHQRHQSVATHSITSSSHPSHQEERIDKAPQELIMQAFDEVPDQLESYVPEDPNDCPLVPIHPQRITAMTGVRGPKGISREHAKIYYNFQTGAFEMRVLSVNGLYHEDTFLPLNQTVELNHGDTIVIGMVDMTFLLPDITLTEAQRARHESTSRPMSFSFENGQGEVESDELMDENSASEVASVDPRHLFHMPVSHYDSEDDILSESELEDPPSSPEPRRKKKKPVKQKLKLKFSTKPSRPQMPPPRKEVKSSSSHKRKHNRERDRERDRGRERDVSPDYEVARKRQKMKFKELTKERTKQPKEPEEPKKVKVPKESKDSKDSKEPPQEPKEPKEPPKEKGKAPLKATPAKPLPTKAPAIPAKEPAQVKVEKVAEPAKPPKSQSPTLARKPTIEGRESGDEGEQEGTITAEMIKRHNLPESLIGMVMEKRKGPGRPPKDGVMSKRQRAQLVKQGKEIEKARAAGLDPADLPMPTAKPKVARPRKDSNANGEGDDEDVRETTEKGDGTGLSGDKKQTKPNKPPRTPSPEMKIEDYTEEQLQRPSANYVVLIHEAISSSKTGQMNLQQIYNYIERKYPWYKFKTTTSGWQSSVRHNLGQHDAFVKGDKEGKGFNWRINPEVSIEKERRKRQVSPQVSHSQRQGFYPPPNGYPPYAHPGPYYPGMPGQGAPSGVPQPPPPNVEPVQPRLPPSLARSAATATPTAQGAPNPSPYASPWTGGNLAHNPPNQNLPRPFPQAGSQGPPPSSVAPSGQYGVLFPTSAPQSQYGGYGGSGPYGNPPPNPGATPYSNGPNRPYTPYATAAPNPPPSHQPSQPPPQHMPILHQLQQPRPVQADTRSPHPSGRYPLSTKPALIHQLEAFREVYLQKTPLAKSAEEAKVDNVIRALVHPEHQITLTAQEKELFDIITKIATVRDLGVLERWKDGSAVKQEGDTAAKPSVVGYPSNDASPYPEAPKTAAASTAAAIAASDAAVAASSGIPGHTPTPTPSTATNPSSTPQASTTGSHISPFPPPAAATMAPMVTAMATVTVAEPHKFTPNMGGPPNFSLATAAVGPTPIRIQTARPSVEPLTPVPGTPVPGSPAVTNGAIHIKKPLPEFEQGRDTVAGAKEVQLPQNSSADRETPTSMMTDAKP